MQKIDAKDIRKGDRIRRENPEGCSAYLVVEYIAEFDGDGTKLGQHYLLERPVAMPTEPGYYLDVDGDVWRLGEYGVWRCGDTKYSAEDIEIHAPFTRLEPVPETAKKVLKAVEVAMNKRDWSTAWSDIADVWADVGEQFGVES